MNAIELSFAVEALIALLVVAGAGFTFLGCVGLLRLPSFYERVHPPTLGTTFGTLFVCAASMILFSILESRPVLHELVIAVFVVVTTPITFTLLLRAAVRRTEPAAGEDAAAEGRREAE
jgi:multicomponent K+:H+ antiporter subunit G